MPMSFRGSPQGKQQQTLLAPRSTRGSFSPSPSLFTPASTFLCVSSGSTEFAAPLVFAAFFASRQQHLPLIDPQETPLFSLFLALHPPRPMPTLREQIALKRAEARNSPAKSKPGTPQRAGTPGRSGSPFGTPLRAGSPFGGGGFGAADELLEDKNVSGQIAKARRTGECGLWQRRVQSCDRVVPSHAKGAQLPAQHPHPPRAHGGPSTVRS